MGLAAVRDVIASADALAWSYRARRRRARTESAASRRPPRQLGTAAGGGDGGNPAAIVRDVIASGRLDGVELPGPPAPRRSSTTDARAPQLGTHYAVVGPVPVRFLASRHIGT
jgi:hypothetical protein